MIMTFINIIKIEDEKQGEYGMRANHFSIQDLEF